jgi:hypothetical protein
MWKRCRALNVFDVNPALVLPFVNYFDPALA